MESYTTQSLFQDLRSRELRGFRVRKQPNLSNLSSDSGGPGHGVVSVEHGGSSAPPFALSFGKKNNNSHFLAVSDEDGYVSLYDTRRKLPSFASCRQKAVEARVCDWVAHNNAIFDICWIKDDTRILTASGDQTIKVWDVDGRKCIGVLIGHTGSVKSLHSHPSNPDVFVSGSRDGSLAFWDLRCKYTRKNRHQEPMLTSIAVVKGAHVSGQRKRVRRGKAASMSITSVLYLRDEVSTASAGAVNSVVKFWDTRSLKAPVGQTYPQTELSTEKERLVHGISCLSQDSNGMFLSATCMDNRIYLYSVLQLENGPISTFSGCRIESFYVKSAISPDAAHILSGSSDGNTYIWQVRKPQLDPIKLEGHEGEVTAVDWCASEVGKVASSSDDFTVRIWNTHNNDFSSSMSPSSIRRRVTAIPSMECRKLFTDENPVDAADAIDDLHPPQVLHDHSPHRIQMPEINTPKSTRRILSSATFLKEGLEMHKTPDAKLNSPSSVLNPPSSLKRTIRDYFVSYS